MHIEARLEASHRPSPTPRLRRASRADFSPHETSAETLDVLSPSAGLQRSRPPAADPLRRSKKHHRQADARPRHASRGTAATRRLGATPRRVPHRAALGATRSLAGPFTRPFDSAAIRRSPRRLEQFRPSEDGRSPSRACFRAPGPHRSTNHATPPRRTTTRGGDCVETLRTEKLVDGMSGDPEGSPKRAHRSPLSPQSSSPPATGLARPLRRDASRRRSPTPSSAGTRSLRQGIAFELRRALGRCLPSPPRPLRPARSPGRRLPTPKGRAACPGGRLAAEAAVAERAGHLGAPKSPSAGRRTV